ncbi:MAG: DinB family protein, partial [Chitinophagaceae bacterium]|nr:DinB family protein [Chitinophagaceae bacterium]
MQTTQADLLIKMSIAAWDSQNKYFSNFIETVSEEQLQKEIAPGR